MSGDDEYFLGYRRAEQERLREQARQLAPESEWLFDRVGVATGAVVEIGCGPEGCLGLLATRVGASGSVVGVERSDDAVVLARAMVRERNLVNVEVIHGDGRVTGLPRSAFDFAERRVWSWSTCHNPRRLSAKPSRSYDREGPSCSMRLTTLRTSAIRRATSGHVPWSSSTCICGTESTLSVSELPGARYVRLDSLTYRSIRSFTCTRRGMVAVRSR